MTGTAGAPVEHSITSQDNTAPSGEANLGAHVLETNQVTSPTTRTVEEILGAHPIDDTFWENTNPTGVSIDRVNSIEITNLAVSIEKTVPHLAITKTARAAFIQRIYRTQKLTRIRKLLLTTIQALPRILTLGSS